jgi:hypothetical protein
MNRTASILLSVATALGASAVCVPVAQVEAAQRHCPTGDRAIPKKIRFETGRTSAVIKDTIRVCTSHEYTFRAKAGQHVTLHLATGKFTDMTLLPPRDEALLDGGKDWEGDLPDTGTYTLTVATDRTAQYTLEITIR